MINAPHITSPEQNDQFNVGTVTIEWDPIASISFAEDDPYNPLDLEPYYLTYEINYTDNYDGENTNWYVLKKRIPFTDTSYTWHVGKMVKSSTVRVRMRSKDSSTETFSDWSLSDIFSINVFDLTAPQIVSPLPNVLYTEFVLIILDESLVINTYNQKVRYTVEYSSNKSDIDWTIIASNIPVGQNVIRWNIESLPSADDYVVRVTARNNSTCLTATESNPDQIARSFAYHIRIQQSGVFVIDTKPPQAVLGIEGNTAVTNQVNQVINVFAYDESSDVKHIQLRECNVGANLLLGNISDAHEADESCPPISELLQNADSFDHLISDKPIDNTSKVHWVFDAKDDEGNPTSAIKKVEALLTDIGGNNSLQESSKVFLPVFNNSTKLNDFDIVIENRDNTVFGDDGSLVETETATFEVVYAGADNGELWVLEPYARLVYAISGVSIQKIVEYNDTLYLFSYNSDIDVGSVYRHDATKATLLNTFSDPLSSVKGVAEYRSILYVGFENGQLWSYNGFAFSIIHTFSGPINTLFGDNSYLYIGFQNSSTLSLYNGTDFVSLVLEG